MSYTVTWLVEPHIIEAKYSGVINTETFFQSDLDIEALAKTGTSPLYLVIDTLNITEFSPKFKEMLQDIKRLNQATKIEMTVVISDNKLLNFFGQLTTKIVNFPVRVYKTREEAIKLLARQVPELMASQEI